MVLEQATLILLVLVQPWKTRPCLTERLLMGHKESYQTNKIISYLLSHRSIHHLLMCQESGERSMVLVPSCFITPSVASVSNISVFNVSLNGTSLSKCLLWMNYPELNVMWLFLTVPWVGLQCVIVVFPDHTHLLIESAPKLEQTLRGTVTNIEGKKQDFYQIITYILFISL